MRPERRTDRYLLLPDTDALGAKLRGEEQLELKVRSAHLARLSRPGATGRKERWTKWSLRLADPRVDDLLDHAWVAVDKTRWHRRFAVPSRIRRRIRADEASSNGCDVEVVALEVAGEAWWTLGFESFGAPERLAANFDAVTSSIFGRRRFPRPLEHSDSFGYPRWLQDRPFVAEPDVHEIPRAAPGIAALVRACLPSG